MRFTCSKFVQGMELHKRWELSIPITMARFLFTNLASCVVEVFLFFCFLSLPDVFSVCLIFLLPQKLRHKFQFDLTLPLSWNEPCGFPLQSNLTYSYSFIFFTPFSFGKVGLIFIMLLLYRWFCHQFLIKGPIKWEKIPSKSEKKNMSRVWFTVKEDSIHIKTMTFCFWCVYCRGAPRMKRATVFSSKPNPRRDLIEFRFYIYSDNKEFSGVSNNCSGVRPDCGEIRELKELKDSQIPQG